MQESATRTLEDALKQRVAAKAPNILRGLRLSFSFLLQIVVSLEWAKVDSNH